MIVKMFRIPGGCVIAEPSGSGETEIVLKLIANRDAMFTPISTHVLYCYDEYGKHILELQRSNIETFAGVPINEQLQSRPFLLAIDDLMLDIDKEFLNSIFTRKAHHNNFFVIFMVQNLFDNKLKVVRSNSQYIIIMRGPSAELDVRTLASQLLSGKTAKLISVYRDATRQPYSYLLIDFHPLSDHRILTNIFPGEFATVYK